MNLKLFIKNKTVLLLFIINCGFISPILAQTNTYSGTTGGYWNTASNWSLNLVPTSAHDVVIPDNKIVKVNGASAICNTLVINAGANNNDVQVGVNTLTVTGTITINAPTSNSITKMVSVTSGTLNCGSIVMSSTTASTRVCRVSVTAGTINVSGDIIMNGTSSANQLLLDGTSGGTGSTGGILNIGGNFIGTGGDVVPGNFSTINFNGSVAQTIPSVAAFQYNNLMINNTSVAGCTLGINLTASTILGNITVQTGIFNNGGKSITGNPANTFTVANDATFQLAGTTSAFPSGFGTRNLDPTSNVEYIGTGNQTVFDIPSPGYGNLIISTSGTKTVATNGLDIQGNLTVNSGAKFAFSSFTTVISGNVSNTGTITTTTGTINVMGNWENSGVYSGGTSSTINLMGDLTNSGTFTAGTGASNLNVAGNWKNTGTFTAGTSGTVTFNSTSAGNTITGIITAGSGKFNNLTFNGVDGGWIIASDMDVAKTLTVTNGTVDINGTLTVAGTLAITVTTPGALIFENNASLLQTGFAGTNVGNITYKRTTPPLVNTDYTYWSSPVAGYTLGGVSQNLTLSNEYYSYDATIDNWKQESAATIMLAGKGYSIRGPEPTSSTPPSQAPFNAFFVGVPNNGNVSILVTSLDPILGTSNLIGNPYPSAIDANAFIAANSSKIDGTLYFWTHNTGLNNDGQYTNNDYASYNGTGGVAGNGGIIPSGKIAAGQSFFTTGMTSGNVNFTNAMRVAGISGNNSQFFKIGKTNKTANAIENDRIWLNMVNAQGVFKQALVGYVTGATNDYENFFDGESLDGNLVADFYSVNQDKNLVIQGRALPFDQNDMVPLGFRSAFDGDFTINIDQVDGVLTDQAVFIEDKLTNTIADLKNGAYTFTTLAGTFNDRFVLRYNNKTLGIANNFDIQSNKVLVSNKNNEIKVNSFVNTIDTIEVYDLLGKQIYHKVNVNSNELSIFNLVSSNQTLLVKTTLQNGETVTDKIIY